MWVLFPSKHSLMVFRCRCCSSHDDGYVVAQGRRTTTFPCPYKLITFYSTPDICNRTYMDNRITWRYNAKEGLMPVDWKETTFLFELPRKNVSRDPQVDTLFSRVNWVQQRSPDPGTSVVWCGVVRGGAGWCLRQGTGLFSVRFLETHRHTLQIEQVAYTFCETVYF